MSGEHLPIWRMGFFRATQGCVARLRRVAARLWAGGGSVFQGFDAPFWRPLYLTVRAARAALCLEIRDYVDAVARCTPLDPPADDQSGFPPSQARQANAKSTAVARLRPRGPRRLRLSARRALWTFAPRKAPSVHRLSAGVFLPARTAALIDALAVFVSQPREALARRINRLIARARRVLLKRKTRAPQRRAQQRTVVHADQSGHTLAPPEAVRRQRPP